MIKGTVCVSYLAVCRDDAKVKYGVRSPKFIRAPCAQLHSLAETPQTPPPLPNPSAFGLIYEAAIGQPR
jgi:hypothetical protein